MKIQFLNTAKKFAAGQEILTEFEQQPPAFATLPNEQATHISAIETFARANRTWRHIIIIGIGGSSLPARTLIDALGNSKREFYFLENVDPAAANQILANINWKKTLVLVISKSGNTLETIANFFVVKKYLGKSWQQQTVFLTNAEKGFLHKFADQENVQIFAIPAEIGGRFSIFSPVGLLPAALAGIDLQKLLSGTKKADAKQAFQFAKIQAAEFRRGKNISVFCVYRDNLKSLTQWYEQLLAESIGKNSKIGITPSPAVGAIDQHSKLQLWRDGPADKFYIFVGTQNFGTDLKITNPEKEFSFLKNKTFAEVLRAEFLATTKSLAEKKRPLAIFDFAKIGPAELGEFLQFWMLEVYFLAKILNVNFANQPGVERGKVLARKRLGGN